MLPDLVSPQDDSVLIEWLADTVLHEVDDVVIPSLAPLTRVEKAKWRMGGASGAPRAGGMHGSVVLREAQNW